MNNGQSSQPTSKYSWRKIADIIADWWLIATGAGGVIVGILDLLGLDGIIPVNRSLSIIMTLVSALALALGIERRTTIENLKVDVKEARCDIIKALNGLVGEVDSVQQALVSAVSVRALTDEKMVYREASRLVNEADDSDIIRATSLGSPPDPPKSPPFDRYLLGVAKRIRASKERGGSLTYRIVMGYRPTNGSGPPLAKREGIRQRKEVFRAEGVLDRLLIRSIDTTWSLDILLVGDSMIIGFPTLAGRRHIRLGLRITDKDFVGRVTQWFDDFLWDNARVETWVGEESME